MNKRTGRSPFFTQLFWITATRLLIANTLVLAIALHWRWNPLEVILIYLVQAAIIGVTQRLKIRDMIDNASSDGRLKSNVLLYHMLRPGVHDGFAVIYGLLWLVLGVVVLVKFVILPGVGVPLIPILLSGSVFSVVHWWSYRSNRATDRLRPINSSNAFMLPIARLLPLFVIAVGLEANFVYASSSMVVWMIIKTLVDVGIHVHEHRTTAA